MDYEKAYKEALNWMRSIYPTMQGADREDAEHYFPELKESEDEQHRKWILEYLYDGLRKSDEQFKDQFKSAIAWLEKQGEQKPTDKVEPKFKIEEGKWYVCTQTYVLRGKIVVIKGQTYQAERDNFIKGEDGCLFIDRHDGKAADYFRLWTIKDAKDGDVLYHKSQLTGIEYIVMSRGVNDHDTVDSYFRYNSADGFGISIPSVLSAKSDDITPATKEQRDLLFQKMKEAGYEWDAEKKELKKIEQELSNELAKGKDYGVDGLYAALDILQKTFGEVEGYQTDDGILEHECAISAVKELYEQKPAWSEESDKRYKKILDLLSGIGVIDDLTYEESQELQDYFKSLKPNHWKPSEEQMKGM